MIGGGISYDVKPLDKRIDRSQFEKESWLLFPLGDVPNHRFPALKQSNIVDDNKNNFYEDGRFFIRTEPGFISFETNAVYNKVRKIIKKLLYTYYVLINISTIIIIYRTWNMMKLEVFKLLYYLYISILFN